MAPGRANGLYVGAVGGGECRLFLRVGRQAAARPSDLASTVGFPHRTAPRLVPSTIKPLRDELRAGWASLERQDRHPSNWGLALP